MTAKKHLNFDALRQEFSDLLYQTDDPRQKTKVGYKLHDIVMSGFACMFLQCPSLLEFQRRISGWFGRNNLQTQFRITDTPENTAMRDCLDKVDSQLFSPLFKNYLTRLQRGNQLKQYQFLQGMYLLPMDGTEYFSSKDISCNCCLQTPSRTGVVTYSHKVVQAAIVHPGIKQVIPLMPEAICNTDGSEKQDCEINGAKRLMKRIQKDHPRMTFIRTGDSLYAHTPFIKETLEQGDHYLFAIKPGDHKALTKTLKSVVFSEHRELDEQGRKFTYEWVNQQPLTADSDSIKVNVLRCRLTTIDKKTQESKTTYIGTWITDLSINEENIAHLVRGARARWRIENECFNTLKNQGYELDHNFGHGKKNLSFNFYILTLLAFFTQQIADLCDDSYQAARKKMGTLKGFWQDVRALFNRFLYESWYKLLEDVTYNTHTYIMPEPTG